MDDRAIELRDEHGIPVVHISGDVDHANARDVYLAAHDVLLRGVPQLVFDLTQVRFLDSAGMSALVRTHLKAKALGTRVTIRGVNSGVRRSLTVCGITELVEVVGYVSEGT